MARGPMTVVLRHLHRLVPPPETEQPPDRHLLERFLTCRDEAAFAALVRRHGAMVLGVGRRLLHDTHAAEDVFQATFLILARRGASVRQPEALGSWLYGVAYRVAADPGAAARRRRRERLASVLPSADPAAEVTWRELGAVLDEELRRLPERYRAPLVLCFLEGKTQDEAARELGCCKSTLRRRLEHGRERLRRRLLGRGVALSVGLLAASLSQGSASAAVSAALVEATVRAGLLSRTGPAVAKAVSAEVAALVEGVGTATAPPRLTTVAAVVLAVALLGTGASWLAHHAAGARPALPAPDGAPQAAHPLPEPQAPEQPRDPPSEPRNPLRRELNHRSLIRVVAFAPGDRTLLSGGDRDQTVRLWDLATGKELAQMRTEHQLTGIALAPDGATVATGEFDGTVRLWQAATGKPLATLRGHTGAVFSVAFTPDGRTLASGSVDRLVCLWDVTTGKCLHELRGHRAEVWWVAFAPDGKTLASGGKEAEVHLWEVATGKGLRPLRGEQQEVWELSFSPDGKFLAGACGRETPSLRLWDVAARREVRHMGAPGDQSWGIAFSPNGKLLASASLTGDVCLWETLTGKEVGRVAAHRGQTDTVSFTADGRTLASGGEDGFVRLWEVQCLGTGSRMHPGELAAGDLETLWDNLAAADAAQGYQAVWALAATPRQALPLCRERLLRPAARDPQLPQRLARLIADLDANEFEVREKATMKLVKLGKAAEPAVRQALDNPASLEARRRLERVLAPLQEQVPPGETLQAFRAVEVLEQVGSPEAEEVLKKVAKDAAEVGLRQEARAALDRLARRPGARP